MSKDALKNIKIGLSKKKIPTVKKQPIPSQEESDKVLKAIKKADKKNQPTTHDNQNKINVPSKKNKKRNVQALVSPEIFMALTIAVAKTQYHSKTDYINYILEKHLRKEGYLE